MSIFSGKCDLYDVLVAICGIDDNSLDNVQLEQMQEDNTRVVIPLKTMKDLVPYYPFVERYGSSGEGKTRMVIGPHSFIYEEERQLLHIYLKRAKSIYRKCKRNNWEFKVEDAASQISLVGNSTPVLMELCKRVKEHPYSNNISGLSLDMHNYFRNRLKEEMIKVGYSEEESHEWCFNERKLW